MNATVPPVPRFRHRQLREISSARCVDLLLAKRVGRIAFVRPDGEPRVIPVNYGVDEDSLWFTTRAGSEVARFGVGRVGAFEVDSVDNALERGWSVQAVGPLVVFSAPSTAVLEGRLPDAWPDQAHDLVLRMRWTSLTGRQLVEGS